MRVARAYTCTCIIALEPGTGTGLREIDVRHQRSSVPGKLLKELDGPKTALSC